MDNSKVYLDCECISAPNKIQDRGYDAINTMCDTSCNNLWYFISLCFFVMFFTFLSTMPALSATLRYNYTIWFKDVTNYLVQKKKKKKKRNKTYEYSGKRITSY